MAWATSPAHLAREVLLTKGQMTWHRIGLQLGHYVGATYTEFEKMQHHKGSFPLLLPAVHAKFMSLSGPHLPICIAPYQATSPAAELAISDTPTGERMKQSTSPATNPRQRSSD